MEAAHNGHPSRDHEHSDVRIGGVVKFLMILIVSGVLIQFLLSGMWKWFGHSVAPTEPQSPFAGPRELPPQPRLQVHPRDDLQFYLQAEQEKLNTYGADPATGAIHIPIDRAMELVMQRGLPSRQQPPSGAAPSAVQTAPVGFVPPAGPGSQGASSAQAPGAAPANLRGGPARPQRERSTPDAPRP
jgi:hypothetical protein